MSILQNLSNLSSGRKRALAFVVLAILSAAIYSNIVSAPFVFDDHEAIALNPKITALRNFLDFSGTRYVGNLTFALNYAIGGLNTFGYHAVNVLIHILNSILVFILVESLFKTPAMKTAGNERGAPAMAVAFGAGLIFAAHPVQTQAVTYLSQRFASLAAFFYIGAVVLYVSARLNMEDNSRMKAGVFYLLGLVSTVAALKTKEISFTLPLMIMLVEWFFFRGAGNNIRRLLSLAPYLLSMLVIPLTIIFAKGGAFGADAITEKLGVLMREDLATISRYDYLITEFRVIVTYLRLIFFPADQNLDYDYPVFHTFASPSVFVSFLFLLSVFIGAVYLRTRSLTINNRYGLLISFGVFWFFLALSVESSIIPISDVIFEHRLYLPSAGIIFAFSAFLFWLRDRFGFYKAVPVVIAVMIIAAGVTAYARNSVWADELALWKDTSMKSPNKARPYSNIGFALAKAGRLDEALKYFDKLIRLKPEFWLGYFNAGEALMQSNRAPQAVRYFEKVVSLKPDHVDGYSKLGIALTRSGRPDDALRAFARVLSARPYSPDAHINAGNALMMSERFDEAAGYYRKALALDPSSAEARADLDESLRRLAMQPMPRR
ncbi:tetratricopeptide repeat protein [bacterium]|nr:MAG: tetratricopeptide repeat protein [bacterium]